MRASHLAFVAIAGSLLLSACATQQASSLASKDCDVSWIDEGLVGAVKACELRILAKRCAISDACYIRCEANGGLTLMSGGCGHVCHNGVQTDEDMAKNGGPYATQESVDCYNESR
jgi:hypothetical protein